MRERPLSGRRPRMPTRLVERCRLPLRILLSTPFADWVERGLVRWVRHAPYNARFVGGIVQEITRHKTTSLTFRLGAGPLMTVPPISEGVSLYVVGALFAERATTAYLSRILRPGMVFLDVGANMGFYTLLGAQRVGATGRVIAFEPFPVLAAHIRSSIEINGFGDRACLEECAVSAIHNESVTFYAGPLDNTGASSLLPHGWLNTGTQVTVRTTRLDDYLTTHGITQVDVMKIDIEGAEMLAFRGMARTLQERPPRVLVVELFPSDQFVAEDTTRHASDQASIPTHVYDLLQSHGYTCLEIEPDGQVGRVCSREEIQNIMRVDNYAFVQPDR